MVFFGALSLIPLGILLMGVGQGLRNPKSVLGVAPAFGGVAMIFLACLYIVLDRRARGVHASRYGKACVRCGYDMQAHPTGVCPECGLANAAHEPYTNLSLLLAVLEWKVGRWLGFGLVVMLLGNFLWRIVGR